MPDTRLLRLSSYLVDYPFADRLFPHALDAIHHVRRWGSPVILSDGDAVFQPRKIERSGLFEAVNRNVLIFIHKEKEWVNVERLHPAHHYVLIDDKLRILTAMKKIWNTHVTTVFIQQGHYAHDPHLLNAYPPADMTLKNIGEILNFDFSR